MHSAIRSYQGPCGDEETRHKVIQSHTRSQAFSPSLASPNFALPFLYAASARLLQPPSLTCHKGPPPRMPLTFTPSFRFGSRSPFSRSLLRSPAAPPLDPCFLYPCSWNIGKYRLAWSLSLVSQASSMEQTLPEGRNCVLLLFVATAVPGGTERWLELDRAEGCTALSYKVHPCCRDKNKTPRCSQSARD